MDGEKSGRNIDSNQSENIVKMKKKIKQMREDKERLKEINEKLKKRKKHLQKKVDDLKEENNNLLNELRRKNRDKMGEKIILPSETEIRADIKSEKKIKVENQALVKGSLHSEKDIIIAHGNKVEGDVISRKGDVKIGNSSEIKGLIKAEVIQLAEEVKTGQVIGSDEIIIHPNCELSDIYAIGDLELGENVQVCGDIKFLGKIDVPKGVSVKGALEATTKENLEKELEESYPEVSESLPIFFNSKKEQIEDKEEDEPISNDTKNELATEKIERVRELLRTARDQDVDISEERKMVKKAVSFYKEDEYDNAYNRLDRCKARLEDKLDSVLGEVIEERKSEEQSGSETEEKGEHTSTRSESDPESVESENTPKEEVIKSFQQIKGVGRSTAEKLYEGGYRSIEELEDTSKKELSEVNGIGQTRSQNIKNNI